MSVTDMARMESAKQLARELGLEGPDDGALLAEEYGMVGQPEPAAPARDLEIIEAEILFYKRHAGRALLAIGKRLMEAKAQLRHGEWLPWLRDKVDISERSAQDFMRIAKEYSESAEIADLGASKALALLGLPASERADFVAEKHTVDGVEKSVSEMTAKELKRAIEERDDARRGMEAMKARAEVAEQSREKMEQDMRQLRELNRRAKETVEEKNAALAKAEGDVQTLKEQMEELRSKPVDVAVQIKDASAEQIAEAKKAARAEAEKKHKTELAAREAELKKAQAEAKKAREEAKAANVSLQEAERKAAAARQEAAAAGKLAKVNTSQNMVKFSILFQQTQDNVNRMAEAMEQESPENQGKIRAAMRALAEAIEEVAAE